MSTDMMPDSFSDLMIKRGVPVDVHRLALMDHGDLPATRCGIMLSREDTGVTYGGRPIETTFFDDKTTCSYCLKPPKLRAIK